MEPRHGRRAIFEIVEVTVPREAADRGTAAAPNASENGRINPSTTFRTARDGGIRPICTLALHGVRKMENIRAGSAVVWGIPASDGYSRR